MKTCKLLSFRPIKCCMALGLLAFLPIQSQAIEQQQQVLHYDAKTYPGIMCEAQAVSEISLFSNIGFEMVNADKGRRSVVCPIVRDNTENQDGTYSVMVYVNNPVNRSIECSLYSYSKFSNQIDSYTSSTSSAGDQTISLNVDASEEDGYYAINCELPYLGVIRSYEAREYLDTDNEGGIIFQYP